MWNVDKFKVKTFNGGCLISYQQIVEFSQLIEHTLFPGVLNGNNIKYFWKLISGDESNDYDCKFIGRFMKLLIEKLLT